MSRPSRLVLLLLAVVLGAVGAGCSSGAATADARTDGGDDVAPQADAGTDTSPDTSSDALPDATVEHTPVVCGPDTACNERLDGQGRCPGSCVAVGTGLTCGGEVSHGLCFGRPPIVLAEQVEGGAFVVSVRAKPEEARVGDAFTVTFDVKNVSGDAADARVGIKPGAAATLVDTGDFDPLHPLTLAAGAARTITAHLRADVATILNPGNWSVLDVSIAGTPLDPRGLSVAVPIAFATGPRACGARTYPDFNTAEGENYGNARCCGGVFYPGAQCCVDADCASGGGRCADGICVTAAPHIAYSGSPLAGPQRVLIVFVDEPEPKPDPQPRVAPVDVCTDLAAARGADLRLPLITKWFADVARRRVGRGLADFQFTVLAGIKTEDFAPANDAPPAYGAALEAFLVARGCTAGWGRDFDRVVIVSPRVQTGTHQGLVYAADRVAVQVWSASIATHELAHTFGATDRYFDVGGQLQYGGALMSTVDRDPQELGDAVFWAEAGLGDVDRDGVIDALAFARAPTRLVATEVSVDANKNNRSLFVRVRVAAEEAGGAPLVVIPREVRVQLVGAGVSTVLTIDGHRPGVAPSERSSYATSLRAGDEITGAVFDDLVAAKKAKVRVRIDHAFTTPTFARQLVSLDETRDVEVPVTCTSCD